MSYYIFIDRSNKLDSQDAILNSDFVAVFTSSYYSDVLQARVAKILFSLGTKDLAFSFKLPHQCLICKGTEKDRHGKELNKHGAVKTRTFL